MPDASTQNVPTPFTHDWSEDGWGGIFQDLSTAAVDIYKTRAQTNLLHDQIVAKQIPSVVTDKYGRPSGAAAPYLAVGQTAGISSGLVFIIIGAVLLMLLRR
jgi:hypothetical protein